MAELLHSIDAALAPMLPPLFRIMLWGVISGAIGMLCYALTSPKEKILAIRREQKETRGQLLRYDGDWQGLRTLIARDSGLAFRQLGLLIIPFILSVAPLVLLMMPLAELFGEEAYSSFGPEWMRGFDFWYIVAAMACSLVLKVAFRIV